MATAAAASCAAFDLCCFAKPTTNSTTTAIAATICAAIVSAYGYRPIQSLVGTLLRYVPSTRSPSISACTPPPAKMTTSTAIKIDVTRKNGPIGIFTEVNRNTKKITSSTTAAAMPPTHMPCESWLIE